MSNFDAGPTDTADHGHRDGWFVRAAGAVGDLGNPFYREERQREVWNEASAVGFQLMLFLGMAAAGAMVWVGGQTALPYAWTSYGVLGVAAGVTLAYSRALGVHGNEGARVLQPRLAVYGVLLAALVVGTKRALPEGQSGFVGGVADGAIVGAVIGAVVVVVSTAITARRDRRRRG